MPLAATGFTNMASTQQRKPVYRITFHNQGQVYEVYARGVCQSDLYGFIEIEDYVFNNRSQVVVDPAEEKLKTEFSGVTRSYIPMHCLIRIDEVKEEGQARIAGSSSEKIMPFPMPMAPGTGKTEN